MKKTLSALFVIAIVIAACNNKKPKDGGSPGINDNKEQVSADTDKMKAVEEAMEKRKEELTNLTPLEENKLKAMLPQQLMGTAGSNLDISNSAGANVASADYKTSDSTEVKLTIVDCAGPGGAGIYGMHIGTITLQEEANKIIDFKGDKAIEHCDIEENTCTFIYFAAGRFLVTLEGSNVSIDGLKQAAKGLDIK